MWRISEEKGGYWLDTATRHSLEGGGGMCQLNPTSSQPSEGVTINRNDRLAMPLVRTYWRPVEGRDRPDISGTLRIYGTFLMYIIIESAYTNTRELILWHLLIFTNHGSDYRGKHAYRLYFITYSILLSLGCCSSFLFKSMFSRSS